MKPRTMASSPEISMTRIRTISSSVIGILASEQGYDDSLTARGFERPPRV
jgi:hypothetical protein